MASIREDKRTGRYLILFRFGGQQFQRSLKTTSRREAADARARVDETIRLIERGRLEMPDDADPATFILSDGKQARTAETRQRRSLSALFEAYEDGRVEHAKEQTTIVTERIHLGHLRKYLPLRTVAQAIGVADVQQYVSRRLKDKWRGRQIKVDTIKKEIATFRAIWNWGERHGHVTGRAPTRGLQYPKRDEKPPFMTRADIERVVSRGGLSADEERELWDSLFLKSDEIAKLLAEVEQVARHPFIYPMLLFVAHTGARRSELLRSEIDDFDFGAGMVKIREKKRSKANAITYRHVPMTKLLQTVMQAWFDCHPGGRYTLCAGEPDDVHQLNVDQANGYFKRTVAKTDWHRVRGFHVFRHSFASNLAARNVDQRMIDVWMGHQTEEMRRRYRHLFPEQQRSAIDMVFGSGEKKRHVA